jgi:hypothetical protein
MLKATTTATVKTTRTTAEKAALAMLANNPRPQGK